MTPATDQRTAPDTVSGAVLLGQHTRSTGPRHASPSGLLARRGGDGPAGAAAPPAVTAVMPGRPVQARDLRLWWGPDGVDEDTRGVDDHGPLAPHTP